MHNYSKDKRELKYSFIGKILIFVKKLWILFYILYFGVMIMWWGWNFVMFVILCYYVWLECETNELFSLKVILKSLKSITFGDGWFCEIDFKTMYFNENLWKIY